MNKTTKLIIGLFILLFISAYYGNANAVPITDSFNIAPSSGGFWVDINNQNHPISQVFLENLSGTIYIRRTNSNLPDIGSPPLDVNIVGFELTGGSLPVFDQFLGSYHVVSSAILSTTAKGSLSKAGDGYNFTLSSFDNLIMDIVLSNGTETKILHEMSLKYNTSINLVYAGSQTEINPIPEPRTLLLLGCALILLMPIKKRNPFL